MFKVSMWDEFSGEPAQDLGIVAATENEAREAAQRAWSETCEASDQPVDQLEFDGALAETAYVVAYSGTGSEFRVRFWVHAA